MWVKFIEKGLGTPVGGVVWTDDDEKAKEAIEAGKVIQCLGPKGTAKEDAMPEDWKAHLEALEAEKKAKPVKAAKVSKAKKKSSKK